VGYATGWYGIPGGPESRSTKVHIVFNGIPVCGTNVGKNQSFQWCANGIQLDYVECERCKNSREYDAARRVEGIWRGLTR